jgi:hypothetical protein
VANLVLGDFNGDHAVDAGDLSSWKSGFGAAGDVGRMEGDANGDQNVDGADFLLWQRQGGIAAITAPVPEPAMYVLLYSSALVFFAARRTIALPKNRLAQV